jgi:hypothetical protein
MQGRVKSMCQEIRVRLAVTIVDEREVGMAAISVTMSCSGGRYFRVGLIDDVPTARNLALVVEMPRFVAQTVMR